MPDPASNRTVTFGGVNPIFRVTDLDASTTYYTGKLGFKVDWQTPVFACVSRGKTALFLALGDQGNTGGWVWIAVSDADDLQAEYEASGAKIRNPPTNYPWSREMQVEDPDGNILRFGSDDRPGEPVGAWLDMYGDRWEMSSPGQWTKISSR